MPVFQPGSIVITQGDPKSIVSWVIRLATGSWWTHGFICTSDHEAIEAVFPRVVKLNIQDRIAELDAQGRDYVIMDYPGITFEQRQNVAKSALTFVGRMYDIWNCLYFLLFKMWKEGGHRLICSRAMAACYFDGMGARIFSHALAKLPDTLKFHWSNLNDGYCTPDEVFRYSDLMVTFRKKNTSQ